MKETKFKAWWIAKKIMLDVEILDLSSSYVTVKRASVFAPDVFPMEDFNLLEYTTVNDKDNQEIYEGHIVKQQLVGGDGQDEIPIPDEIYYGVVIWDFCGWSIDSMGDSRPEIALIDGAIIEIMGHKFENPELLKG